MDGITLQESINISEISGVERVEGPFTSKKNQFFYSDEELTVLEGSEYLIHYLTNKNVKYSLVKTGEEIRSKKKSNSETYFSLGAKSRDEYPTIFYPTSVNLPYSNVYIVRSFAKSNIFPDLGIIEVEQKTDTNLFDFTSIEWQIGGSANEASLFNRKQLDSVPRKFSELSDMIPELQLHESRILMVSDNQSMLDLVQKGQNFY